LRARVFICVLCAISGFVNPARCNAYPARGLYVMLQQEPVVLSSKEEIAKLVHLTKKARISDLFVQIYRANQARFPSLIADDSAYEASLRNLSEDPFSLLIKQAHSRGVKVHAWLNMLSLGNNANAPFLKKYGAGILTRNLKKKNRLGDYKIDNQYFLEPGDTRVRGELSGIISEILRAYPDLDGIQFDYVRYPDTNPAYGYTAVNIERFKKTTGLKKINEDEQAWQDWKRAQVTETLAQFTKEARLLRPGIQVSATGCMPFQRAYYEAFQDWPFWLKKGLVDFVTVMDYSPEPAEFERWVTAIKEKVPDFKKVNIGIGAYKLVNYPKEFKQEFRFSEGAGSGACVIFHYGSLLQNPALTDFLAESKVEARAY
jgi:uncharacterized lipoprotein YddW (UPF0748 family)